MGEPIELHRFRTKVVKRMERRRDVKDALILVAFVVGIVLALFIGMNV